MNHPTGPARRLASAVTVVAGVALLAACGGGDQAADPAAEDYARDLPAGFEKLPVSARVDFPTNPRAECNAITTRIVFRSAFEWESFWQGNAPECPLPPIPQAFDWNREMLAFVTLGERKAAEDRVTVVGKRETADSLIVMVRRTTLQEGCRGTPKVTFPRSLVRLPHNTKAVRFSEEHRKLPC